MFKEGGISSHSLLFFLLFSFEIYLMIMTEKENISSELPHLSEYLLDNQDLTEQISNLLKSYSIDNEKGFLSSVEPLHQLSLSGKFASWELLMNNLSSYLHAKIIRSKILSELPLIEIDDNDLLDEREYNRAILILSMLSHAFVWGEEPFSDFIPSCLAVPWVKLCQRTDHLSVLTHSSIVLSNWRKLNNEKPIELGNIAILNGFLGGIDESNFHLILVEIEAKGGKSLEHMIKAQYYAQKECFQKLIEELKQIEVIQKDIFQSLLKVFTHVDPYIFYNRIRLFLSGWKHNPSLPNGLIYQGVSSVPKCFHGDSGAQSSLIAAFDIFFNIQHSSKFIEEMKCYMPIKHRNFLQYLEQNKFSIENLREKLLVLKQDELRNELTLIYNQCIDQLILFRNKHIQIITVFILSQTNSNNSSEDNESTARGTGGTILMPFLKTIRDETKQQLLN